MSTINENGMLISCKVTLKRFHGIEHGKLSAVHAIVMHQTDSSTAQQTFNSYKSGGNGAHFLIDKQGLIYQTASMQKRCYHVGRLIKSKCLAINRKTCNNSAMAKIMVLPWAAKIKALDAHERTKSYPDRYPINSESIGIEMVGRHIDDKNYEPVTQLQMISAQWLINELYCHFSLNTSDVYKHPDISYKHPGEASSVVWK